MRGSVEKCHVERYTRYSLSEMKRIPGAYSDLLEKHDFFMGNSGKVSKITEAKMKNGSASGRVPSPAGGAGGGGGYKSIRPTHGSKYFAMVLVLG